MSFNHQRSLSVHELFPSFHISRGHALSLQVKAERLEKQLSEAQQQAEAQSSLWREQLNTARTRARSEAARSHELEGQLREMRSRLGMASSTEPAQPSHSPSVPSSCGSSVGGLLTPRSYPTRDERRSSCGSTSSFAINDEPSAEPYDALGIPAGFALGGVDARRAAAALAQPREMLREKSEKLRDGVGNLIHKVDSRMDRAFDKMDGLVDRFRSSATALAFEDAGAGLLK